MHLTLQFLGDTPTEQLLAISDALAAAARFSSTFAISVGGLGCFPNLRNPRIVWAGIEEPDGNLIPLHNTIQAAMEPLGYPLEKRRFSPHLTLGRVRRGTSRVDAARVGEAVKETQMDSLTGIVAGHYALIRSTLKPSGAEYTTLQEFPLGN